MSDVNIYIHYAGGKYVLASDYDRDMQALRIELQRREDRIEDALAQAKSFKAERDTFKAECVNLNNILDQIRTERDALRVQIEAMRELLRKVAPHFAAPPGLGHLHAEIDAAMQAKP